MCNLLEIDLPLSADFLDRIERNFLGKSKAHKHEQMM